MRQFIVAYFLGTEVLKNHRITEQFGLGGIPKIIYFQPLAGTSPTGPLRKGFALLPAAQNSGLPKSVLSDSDVGFHSTQHLDYKHTHHEVLSNQ